MRAGRAAPGILALLDLAGRVYSRLLYSSYAADDLPRVDLGGRRSIKKKNTKKVPGSGEPT